MEYLLSKMELLRCRFLFLYNIIGSSVLVVPVYGNPEATRLYNDLLTNYNRLIRPVGNNTDRLTVKMGLSLSQLIEVNLKNQVMTTSFWVEQEWTDYKLKWNPEDYGGVDYLHVPSEHIWLPDIVLYNNADGNYEVTIMTKATVHYTGRVVWKPPAIYKSFCEIDLEYFPFDQQTCFLKFGSWTYDGYKVNLQHISQNASSDTIDMGIDLQDFYLSVEWDIMRVPAVRHEKYYICCEEPYLDIIFNLTLRRKTLFYTVNLIIPCVGLSFLSVLVFYLPSDSGEKVSLCISVLVSLTVFFLLLAEIIPPTSLTVPLLGKYLLFTMVLVTLSVVVTIAVLNVNFRSPVTHRMRPWVFNFFVRKLPKFLFIERPKKDTDNDTESRFSCSHSDYVEPMLDSRMFDVGGFDKDFDFLPANHCYKIIDYPKHQQPIHEQNVCKSNAVVDFEPPTFNNVSTASPASSSSSSSSQGLSSSSTSSAIPAVPSAIVNDNQLFNGHHQHWIVNDTEAFNSSTMDYMTSEYNGICSYDVKSTYTIEKTVEDAKFIAQHVKNKEKFDGVIEDWKYIAMVLDRLFLWIFSLACILGTALIILQAPSLYDTTTPIDILYSRMAHKRAAMKMLSNTYTYAT